MKYETEEELRNKIHLREVRENANITMGGGYELRAELLLTSSAILMYPRSWQLEEVERQLRNAIVYQMYTAELKAELERLRNIEARCFGCPERHKYEG